MESQRSFTDLLYNVGHFYTNPRVRELPKEIQKYAKRIFVDKPVQIGRKTVDIVKNPIFECYLAGGIVVGPLVAGIAYGVLENGLEAFSQHTTKINIKINFYTGDVNLDTILLLAHLSVGMGLLAHGGLRNWTSKP